MLSHLAGHCVKDSAGIKQPNILRVHLGKHDLLSFYNNSKEYQIFEVIIHFNYDSDYLENDIAILKLKTLIEYSEYILPICLIDNDELKDEVGIVAGWGKNEINEDIRYLLEATMPLVDSQDCRRSYRNFFSNFLNELKFCAGYRNGTSVCAGDSGGGLVIEKNNGWYLKGIVSLGVGSQEAANMCDISQFVLFTDVMKYINWIVDNVRD